MAAGNAVIGALRVNLGLDSAQFHDGLKGASDRLYKFKAVAAGALAVVASAAATASIGLGIAVKRVIDNADAMSKASQKFGVPIEMLSRLEHAAALSDVSLETLGKGIGRLSRNMLDAEQGLKSPQRAFDSLGISIKNADGSLKSADQMIGEVADKFATMRDGTEKTAVAMQIFGRSGAEMIPLLNGGSAAIKEMGDEATELGLVLDTRTGKSAEAFNDNLTRLGRVWDGLVTKLAAHLLPLLETLSTAFFNFVRDKAKVEGFFTAISDAIKWIVTETLRGISTLENFGAVLSQIGKLGASVLKGDWGGIKSAWGGFGEVMEQNRARTEATEAAIKSLWETAAQGVPGIPANDNEPAAGLGGGLNDVASPQEEAERERMERQLEILRERLMTEEEAEFASYQKRLEQLAAFQEARLLSDQETAELRAKIEQDYADRTAAIQEERLNAFASTLGSAGSIIESLTKIMGKEGDKQLGIVKALSLAEALINVYTGITAALRLPYPMNIAAAAAVAAKGFATVAQMRSVSKGSSGGSAAGGGGGAVSGGAAAPAEQAGPARELIISGIRPDQLYTGDVLRNLMDALVAKQNDGYKLVVAA